jgi:hypothetical protein
MVVGEMPEKTRRRRMANNPKGRNKRTPSKRKIEKLGVVLDLEVTSSEALRYVLVRYSDDAPGIWNYFLVDSDDHRTWGYYSCLLVLGVLSYRRSGGVVTRSPRSTEYLEAPSEIYSTDDSPYGNVVRHYYLRRDVHKPYPGLSKDLREGIQELFPAPSKGHRIARVVLPDDDQRRHTFRFWTTREDLCIQLSDTAGTVSLAEPAPPNSIGIESHLGQLVDEVTDIMKNRYPSRSARTQRHRLLGAHAGGSPARGLRPSATVDSRARPGTSSLGELKPYIISFDTFIDDRLHGFGLASRRFVFEAIDTYLKTARSGYFVIMGDPGIGKSSMLAALVSRWHLPVHHFNIALQGISSSQQCLGNLCARLITHFQIPYRRLPEAFAEDGRYLSTLLDVAARALPDGEKLIIPIDALDEVQSDGRANSLNPLFLPVALPERVFFVITSRRGEHFNIPVPNLRLLNLDALGPENMHDVEGFIAGYASRPKVKEWAVQRQLATRGFIELMCQRSEGNFMYLSLVLPAIEAGQFSDGGCADLPLGLRAYYRQHWTQMREAHGLAFDELHEPIVCVLASVKKPVTADMVAALTHVPMRKVLYVLKRWSAFLHEHRPPNQPTSYNIYHSAFREFLAEDVDPGLVKYNATIAERLWNQYRNGTIES